MWNYVKTAFSFIGGIFSKNGDSMGNISGYIITALMAFIIALCVMIWTSNVQIDELQSQVNNGSVALEYQNAMIENNRAENERLNKELQTYIERVRQDFAKIKTPEAHHKEAKNECEAFISELAEAYQK